MIINPENPNKAVNATACHNANGVKLDFLSQLSMTND